jgi:hypothetical protein
MKIKNIKMKTIINYKKVIWLASMILCLGIFTESSFAQKTKKDKHSKEVKKEAAKSDAKPAKVKPVKNTFESIWIMDNQTVMVPVKKTFEMDIMHRFGVVNNGYSDFFGFFAPSNIRLGFNYVPVKNLLIGLSLTKSNMTLEGYGKYAILKQTKGIMPVSVTYYGDVAIDTRNEEQVSFVNGTDRLMYFNQLLIARKITNDFSAQIGVSVSHVNIVNGYFYEPGKYQGVMHNDHVAISFSGRYKIKEAMGVIVNYDQPITKHVSNNPAPNLSFGLELTTSAHAFQFFLGNYSYITPSKNNMFNKNDPSDKQFLIGFNITRLWNY